MVFRLGGPNPVFLLFKWSRIFFLSLRPYTKTCNSTVWLSCCYLSFRGSSDSLSNRVFRHAWIFFHPLHRMQVSGCSGCSLFVGKRNVCFYLVVVFHLFVWVLPSIALALRYT